MTQVLETPIKSPIDKNSYRVIKLENGLKVALIQHPKEENKAEKLAALSLYVDVGGYDDPKDAKGLSHFLEHLIFKGSEKYPRENEFHEFISNHGGEKNASCGFRETMFWFSITEGSFEGAIDRFSSLIKSPLLSENMIEREINAVESEFKNSINVDFDRLNQLILDNVRDDHPARVFIYGSLETLKKNRTNAELYQLVHEHRRNFYVANRMLMAVESSASLDDLQSTIEKYFKDIQLGTAREEFAEDEYKKIFKPQYFDKIHYMKPVADTRTLIISWPLPPSTKDYKTDPEDILQDIIQNVHAGGLVSFLRNKHLITELKVVKNPDVFGDVPIVSLMSIKIKMTEYGSKNVKEILEAVYSYLLLIQQSSMEKIKEIYEDIQSICELELNFYEPKSPLQNTQFFIKRMTERDSVDIIRAEVLFMQFNYDVIKKYIDLLNEPNFNITIIDHESQVEYDEVEPYFGTQFKRVDLPDTYKKLWIERKINPDLQLQPKNEFVCSGFTIYSDVEGVKKMEYPEKVLDVAETYYKLDSTFKVRKLYAFIRMNSPLNYNGSVTNIVLSKLMVDLANRYLEEKYAIAIKAKRLYTLEMNGNSIDLSFDGFNEKMKKFIDQITKDFRNINEFMDEATFNVHKTKLAEEYKNDLLSGYFTQSLFHHISTQNYPQDYDIYHQLNDVTFEQLEKFIPQFFKKLQMKILIQGNLLKEDATNIRDIIVKNIDAKPLDNMSSIEQLNYQFPLGRSSIKIKSFQKVDKNSCVEDFYDLGARSPVKDALVLLLINTVEEPLFDILRTKEQLAYYVKIHQYIRDHSIYISLEVLSQEDKHSAKSIAERLRTFVVSDMKVIMENLDDEKFQQIKDAAIKKLRGQYESLKAEAERNFELLKTGDVFDENEKHADQLEKISKQDLVDFYMKKFIIEQHRNLNVQVVGNSDADDLIMKFITEKTDNEDLVVANIDDFIKTMEFYPKYVKKYE